MAREQTSLQSAAAWASLTTRAIRRQSLVSSSSTSWLMAATGICLASNITKASNRRVKPLPSLAQGTLNQMNPCSLHSAGAARWPQARSGIERSSGAASVSLRYRKAPQSFPHCGQKKLTTPGKVQTNLQRWRVSVKIASHYPPRVFLLVVALPEKVCIG